MAGHTGGTGTFIRQRVTAISNAVLIVFFIWLVLSLAGAGRAEMAARFSNPLVFIPTALLLVSVLIHMHIGMIEVIEDYLHEPRIHRLCRLLNTIFVIVVGVVGLVSLAVLAFGG